ncbi:MAG: DASS family sodium-coupled anion symporter [Luteitalea sp.]|nr:DASS family sodium-coupled anion symporter [Luteitalea sp.]
MNGDESYIHASREHIDRDDIMQKATKPLDDVAPPTRIDEAIGTLSPGEARFEWWRQSVGLFCGPIAFLIVWFLPLHALSEPAHRLAAIVALVVVWWVTEAIPIPATALIGAALTVVFGVTTAREAFAPFADPIIFLFIGSFMIGRAIADHGLDRRLAYSLLSIKAAQGSLARIAVAVSGLALLMSAWMSNTATTAMMLPVAMGVLHATGRARGPSAKKSSYSFLLAIAYAASVGGIMTPVGTPPNLMTIGMLDRLGGVTITFFGWMVLAVPIGLGVAGALFLITGYRLAGGGELRPAATSFLDEQRPAGPWTTGQRNAAIAFGVAVILWVTPGLIALVGSPDSPTYVLLGARLQESVVAIGAASLLFLLPTDWRKRQFTLSWESASRIDWGTILLFGGGLSLGHLMFTTGLAKHIGASLVQASGAESLWAVTAMAIVLGMVMTEVASNTAATNMVVPVVISICQASGLSPVPPAVGACLAASMAFMLPISTPPNAIMYGSGLVPITAMIRNGILLDVVAAIVIFIGLRVLCPLLGFA